MVAAMQRTPLPLARLGVLACIMISGSISLSVVFPFAGYMVDGFGVAETKKDIGYYAGWVAAAFSIGNTCSAYVWGRAADRYGRRPVMLLGLVGTAVTSVLFGVSTNLGYAIAFRFLMGLGNGNLGVAKSYIAEVTDQTNQNCAFSLVGIQWGAGLALGSAIGGYCSRPAHYHPSSFPPDGLFAQYPYLLPMLVTAGTAVAAGVAGFFLLEESLPHRNNHRYGQVGVEAEADAEVAAEDASGVLEPFRVRMLLQQPVLALLVACYFTVAMMDMIFDEIFPLVALLPPERGGLSFKEADTGRAMLVNGVASVTFQLLIFPPVVNRYGQIASFRFATSWSMLYYLLFPSVHYLRSLPTALFWPAMIPVLLGRSLAQLFLFATIFVLISNAVPAHHRAAFNGFAQSAACAARSVAPAIGGSLLSWSLNVDAGFPFNHHFIYVCIASMAALSLALSFRLPRSLESTHADAEQMKSMRSCKPDEESSLLLPTELDE